MASTNDRPNEEKTNDPKPTTEATKDDPLPSIEGKKWKSSLVWDHFTLVPGCPKGNPRATCKHCGKEYSCASKNGTSNLLGHIQIEGKCKKYPYKKEDPKQNILAKMTSNVLVPVSFSHEACRKTLARMVIADELPFRHVEGEGFKYYSNVLQPRFKIPYRITVARDCLQIFLEEKKKLKSVLKGKRVCMTTDTWTSIQNLNYMCITIHFIDSDWVLQKRIISFFLVPNHKGETIGKMVEKCMIEWGVDSVFTLTLDNASSNSGVVGYLKRKTKHWKETILGHEHLHMRCCAHILNLIVCDGLKDLHDSIIKVRNAVRYVRSSPSRLATLKKCVENEKIACKSLLCLDVPTRWNSTYMMLDAAEKFQKAFERLEDEDMHYTPYFGEEETGGRNLGPPTDCDWKDARLFVKFLKVFYNATLRLSGSLYATSNLFFNQLFLIQSKLTQFACNDDECLQEMAKKMKAKHDKYWNVYKINILLHVAVVLDPRYKMNFLVFCFEKMYDDCVTKNLKDKVHGALTRLFEWYVKHYSTSTSQSQDIFTGSKDMEIDDDDGESDSAMLAFQYQKHMEEKDGSTNKSELEKYLRESVEASCDKFDVLNWWKNNSARYQILSVVAKDVLAIPVSSVAFESAFSTGGRVLDPFRSSLSPSTVEALICAQDWLRSPSVSINIRESMDELETYDSIDAEVFGSVPLSDINNVKE